MISSILKKFSGRHYGKYLKKCQPIIERINAIELEYQSLSDAQMGAALRALEELGLDAVDAPEAAEGQGSRAPSR